MAGSIDSKHSVGYRLLFGVVVTLLVAVMAHAVLSPQYAYAEGEVAPVESTQSDDPSELPAAGDGAPEEPQVTSAKEGQEGAGESELSPAATTDLADFTYEVRYDDEVVITGYAGTDKVVYVPATIEDKPVTGVDRGAFEDLADLEEVVLPESVKDLDDDTFYNLPKLCKITIEGNIGKESFGTYSWRYVRNCPILEEIHLGPKVTHYCEKDDRIDVTRFTVDAANTTYRAGSNGILYRISNNAIVEYPTKAEAESLMLEGIGGIEEGAFAGNAYLKDLAIVATEGFEVGSNALDNCTALERLSITGFDGQCDFVGALDGVHNLQQVYVEGTGDAGVELPLDPSSTRCKLFKVGDGIRRVNGGDGYRAHKVIDHLVLGKDVRHIGWAQDVDDEDASHECIYGVLKLASQLEVDEDNPFFCMVDDGFFNKDKTLFYGVPAFDGPTSYTIPDGVTTVGPYAFADHKTVAEVIIPNSVTEIGRHAFDNGRILSVRLSRAITSIGDSVMGGAGYDNDAYLIQGYQGSYAESYAKEKGYSFEAIDRPVQSVYADSTDFDSWDGSAFEEVIPTKSTYVVTSAAQLAWVAKVTNDGTEEFKGKTVQLAADIDLCNEPWTPIGGGSGDGVFRGSFDGQGHSIYNLCVDSYDTYGGLFGAVVSSVAGKTTTFKNVTIRGFSATGKEDCGVLATSFGVRAGAGLTVSNVSVGGFIDQCTNAGGIASVVYCGRRDSSVVIEKCTSYVDIRTSGGTGFSGRSTGSGGILQRIEYMESGNSAATGFGATIRGCTYKGELSGNGWYGSKAGIVQCVADHGIPGSSTIERCVASGSILGANKANAAGIILSAGGTLLVSRCVNNMSVDCGYVAAGIMAEVGGDTTIRECANDGYVSCNGAMSECGGIAGNNYGTIEDCLNLGEVVVHGYTGGIAGNNKDSGVIQRCYDIGMVDENASAVARSGAITSYNTGKIKHCYYDTALVPSGKIVEYEGGGGSSEDALGYGTSALKTTSPYLTWDFTNVWEFNSQYCYGYPVPSGLVGLMRKHRAKSSSNEKSSLTTVVDQDGEPLEGVQVTHGTISGALEYGQTDFAGEVELEYHKDAVGVEAEKDGFITYEDSAYQLPPSKECTIRMVDAQKADQYTLLSAILTYNGYRYELLSETVTLNKKYASESMTLEVKPFAHVATIDHYELVQPDVSEQPLATSSDGAFELKLGDLKRLDSTSKRDAMGNITRQPLYIRVFDNGGGSRDTLLNLEVVTKETKSGELQLGKNASFTIDGDVPLIGGLEVEIPGYKLPISFTFSDDGSWEATVNLVGVDFLGNKHAVAKKEKEDISNVFQWFGSSLKKGVENPEWEDAFDALKNRAKFKDLPIAKRKGFAQGLGGVNHGSFTLNVFGYGKGDSLSPDAQVTLQLYVVLQAGYENEWQMSASPPVVFSVEIKGSAKGGGEWRWYPDDSEPNKSSRMLLEPKLEVKGSLGVGVAHAASVGGYASGELAAKLQFFTGTDMDGLTEAHLTISGGFSARVAGSEFAGIEIKSGTYPIYGRDTSTERLSTQAVGDSLTYEDELMVELTAASAETLSTIDRNTYADISTSWKSSEETLYSEAYGDLAPSVITVGGTPIMLMLADGDTARPTNDKSMLMYSVYDASAGTWSQPAAVWDDGTADFQFDAASDGANAYVVWNNEKGAIANGSTYTGALANTEVAIARFDTATQRFVEGENISANNLYEIQPSVMVKESEPWVSWTTNATDIFRFSGTNKVYCSHQSGGAWHTDEVASAEGCMLMSAFGSFAGTPTCAYVMSEGTSASDSDNYRTYLASIEGVRAVPAAAGATNVSFVRVGEQDELVWTDVSGALRTIADETGDGANSGTGFSGVLRDAVRDDATGNLTLIYTRNGTDNANAYACSYDAATGTWSGEVALTSRANYVEGVSGCYVGGELLTVYNCRTVDLEKGDFLGTNALMWNRTGQESHLVADYARIDKYAAVAGATVPLTVHVSNTGTKTAASYHVNISDSEGVTYVDRTINEPVVAGGELTASFDITLPDDLTQRTLAVTVNDPANGATYTDDAASVTLGDNEVYIDARHYAVGRSHRIAITAFNEGLGAVNGTIELYDCATGRVYDSYAFKDLTNEDAIKYSVPLTMIDWTKTQDLLLGVRLADGDGVLGDHDRTISICSQGVDDVKAVSLDHEELTLDEETPTAQLVAGVLPATARAKGFEWWSTDEEIATVDQDGVVTAVAGGTASIYARETGSGVARACEVKVLLGPKVESVALSKTTLRIVEGATATLKATVLPAEAVEGNPVSWESSDKTVARVEDGVVSAVKEGSATITATAGSQQASCSVSVVGDPNLIRVNDIQDFQSEHPYASSTDMRWVYQAKNADTKLLRLVFSDQTETEEEYDTLTLYGAGGYELWSYSGDDLAGMTVFVPGNEVTVRLESDSSVEEHGFAVVKVDELTEEDLPVTEEVSVGQYYTCGDTLTLDDILMGVELCEGSDVTWNSSDSDVAFVSGIDAVLLVGAGETTLTGTASMEIDGEQFEFLQINAHVSVAQGMYPNPMVVSVPHDIGTALNDGKMHTWIFSDDDAGHMAVTFDGSLDLAGNIVSLYALDDYGTWDYLGEYDEARLSGQTFLIPGRAVKVMSYGNPAVADATLFDGEFEVDDFNVKAVDSVRVGDTLKCFVVDVEPDEYANMLLPMSWEYSYGLFMTGADGTFDVLYENDDAYVAISIGNVKRYAHFKILPEPSAPAPKKLVTSISLTGLSKKIAAGKKVKLTAKVLPVDASNKGVTWKSSNTKVAKVNSAGVVTMAKKSGGKSVTITCTANDGSGVKATYKIKSMKGVVKRVKLSGLASVKAGKSITLKAKVTASKGANTKLKWTCNNPKFASVSAKGKVTAKKAGKGKTVTIVCRATDGSGKKATKKIKIK